MSTLKGCLSKIIALCSLLAPISATATFELLELQIGSQHTYAHVQPIKRVSVGNPAVADITILTSKNILITAKAIGSTDISFWNSETAAAPSHVLKMVVHKSIQLEKQRMQAANSITPSPAGAGIVMNGEISSLEQHAVARQAADTASNAPLDMTEAVFDNQVQIDIKVVEVSRKNLMQAGVNLFLPKNNRHSAITLSGPGALTNSTFGSDGGRTSFNAPFRPGFAPLSTAYNLVYGNSGSGLLAAISILEENGFAYTLAEPSLTTISGQSATFLAGGEFPVPLRSGSGSDSSITIQYKEYGVRLMLTPTVLSANRIFLKVSPEVSELDFNNSVQTGGVLVPGLRVRRTDTSVALGNGESFVISGLISRNTTNNVEKLPWLGDIPILGAFFRSKRFERDDSELLMVVTPTLVRPIARGAKTPGLPGNHLRDYQPSFTELFFGTGPQPTPNVPATGVSR